MARRQDQLRMDSGNTEKYGFRKEIELLRKYDNFKCDNG